MSRNIETEPFLAMSSSLTQKRQREIDKDGPEYVYGDFNIKRNRTLAEAEYSYLPQIPQSFKSQNAGIRSSTPYTTRTDEICFGMLENIQIRINHEPNMQSITFGDAGEGNGFFAAVDLTLQDDRCDILAKGVPIGTMNTKTHVALSSLSSAATLRYIGMIPRSDIYKNVPTATVASITRPSKSTCMMAVLVFGPRSTKSALAKDLSRYHLFLQHPIPMPADIEYENPQYLSMVGSLFSNGVLLPPFIAEYSQHNTDSSFGLAHNDLVNLSTVIDSLPNHKYFSEIDVDRRIGTILLTHQKEAVNFILGRESNENTSTLWELESSTSEQPVYRHAITGVKNPKPRDMFGGILADGMGLGKTLTMIAGITSTLPRAEEFASGQYPNQDVTMPLSSVGSTLVIVPSVLLLDSWVDEIEKHVAPGTLSCYKYHGSSRQLSSSSPLPYDVVLTTYGTVAADFSRGGGVLSGFHWYRLILDEAHAIRNWSTKQFKAVENLSASIRWCVTGTPVQNSLKDLASLIRFLRVPILSDAAIFRKYIEGRRKGAAGVSKPDYKNLKILLGSICLRRCTSTILSSLGVVFIERRPRLFKAEREAYNELVASCDRYIKAAVSGESTERGNRSILTAVLRLRIFCNTGLSGPLENDSEDVEKDFQPDEIISLLQQGGEAICTECKSEILSSGAGDSLERQQDSANHQLRCQDCTERDLGAQSATNFSNDPQVSENTVNDDDAMQDVQFERRDVLASIDDASRRASYPSKILSLLDDIQINSQQDKNIIFSFWRRSLDLVEKLFREERIIFDRVDGSMHPSQRKKVLVRFHDNPSVRVLLMTIGTGAVGLNNLSVASRVHILEPQWNPSVEDQAIGRVVRLGQSKKVSVIRYITEKTIEESIESRQVMKLQLALNGGLKSLDREALAEIIKSTIVI
ncbi:hypothetical protein F5Y19DRAFT_473522 [Xylariaceae sp. FL1651]|nr:hypothetical protein F5Y19DRAFT_473522 [Xylariaceae sp. FL1651]